MSKDAKKIVLLDTHAILHRAYHALPEFTSKDGEPTGAIYGLISMILRIISDLKPNYILAAVDLDKKTYRHDAYKEYKAKRPEIDEALVSQIKRAPEVLSALNIPVYSSEGFEADDILGTAVEQLKKIKGLEIIIASGDMDTMQLIEGSKVKVFTLKKGLNDTVMYDEKGVIARYGFGPELVPDYKGLRGDTSDNIIGIRGIGEKTATTLITKFGSIESIYRSLKKNEKSFLDAGVSQRIIDLIKENKEEAEFSKLLATIRRDVPVKIKVPEKEWKEGIDIDALKKFLLRFGFRSLIARVDKIFPAKTGDLLDGLTNTPNTSSAPIPDEEFKEVSVALWLLDSNITNPKLEDVLSFGRSGSFEIAKEHILKEIKKRNLEFVFEKIEKPLIPIINEMNKYGVLIDKDHLLKLSREYHKLTGSLEKKIIDLAGEKFNINSPKQLGIILFEKLKLKLPRLKKTATGAYSTREEELVKLVDQHKIIPLILEYRSFQKLLSTYIDAIPPLLDSKNRLHATFLQTGTTTGRMSSQNPNLQNIPISTEDGRRIREAFVADKGMKLLTFDYSQIELRIASILSKDKILVDIFKRGEDVHAAVASVIFNLPEEKVSKEQRRQAKVINFGILYGMGVNALRENLSTTRVEAEKFYRDYFSKFTGLAKYIENLKKDATKTGFAETLFGRKRYFEGLRSSIPYVRAAAERMAVNAPFQGTSADIIKLAMVEIDRYIKKEKLEDKVHLTMQIHDELVFEVDEKLVEKVAPQIHKIMENVVPKEKAHGVPILANGYVGDNWNDMEKLNT